MPEGERSFSKWLENISRIVSQLGKPVLVKEVGFGMSKKTISTLKSVGVKTIDISGKGGTNFARIENSRRTMGYYNFMENFGNSTPVSMLEAKDYTDELEIIASGGVRTSMDIVKCLALGARSVAMAARFLDLVDKKPLDYVINEVNSWKTQIKAIMTLLGCQNMRDLKMTNLIFRNDVKDWCSARNIDYRYYANRS